MVRSVIGDETHVGAFVDQLFQSGCSLQVGLAVGRLGAGSSRDAIFALIPTPLNDGKSVSSFVGQLVEPTVPKQGDKRKGSKAKVGSDSLPLQIDADWVGEHARQVSKMLVGGISVVGIYVLATEGSFKNSLAMLWQVVRAVSTALPVDNGEGLDQERLLVHLSHSPRRVSCRSCSITSNFSSMALRPCEWKLVNIMSTLHSFECLYNFDVRLPVLAAKSSKKQIWEIILSTIAMEGMRLKSSKAVIDGFLTPQDKVSASGGSNKVEFFLPFNSGQHLEEVESGKVAGLAILRGSVQARAYCLPREPLSRAIADLMEDILTSLRSRLEILHDEADQAAADPSPHGEAQQDSNTARPKPMHPLINEHWIENGLEYRCSLPRRVFIPWLSGVLACDYLQENETFEDLNERCNELLGMVNVSAPTDILEPEFLITGLEQRSFIEVVHGNVLDPNIKKLRSGHDKLDTHQAFARVLKTRWNKLIGWAVSILLIALFVSWVSTV